MTGYTRLVALPGGVFANNSFSLFTDSKFPIKKQPNCMQKMPKYTPTRIDLFASAQKPDQLPMILFIEVRSDLQTLPLRRDQSNVNILPSRRFLSYHCAPLLVLLMSKPSVFSIYRPQTLDLELKKSEQFVYHFDYGSFDCESQKRPVVFAPATDRFSLGHCTETALFCFDLSATVLIIVYALLAVFQFRLAHNPEWQIAMFVILTLVTLRWYLSIDFRNPCLELLFAFGLVAEGIGLFCLIHSRVNAAR